MDESEVFAAVGEEGFARLIAAFYKQVPGDNILGPMYPEHERQAAEVRLRDFLIYRFGGPQRYIEQRGHPRVLQVVAHRDVRRVYLGERFSW